MLNNVSITYTSKVESVDDAVAWKMWDVNFWGTTHGSTNHGPPAGGRLLQASPRLGLVGVVACGFYSASYALLILQ